jgi:energy-converting hydrogenase Eha subunit A
MTATIRSIIPIPTPNDNPTVMITFINPEVLEAIFRPPIPIAKPKRAKLRIIPPTPIIRQQIEAKVIGPVRNPFALAGAAAGGLTGCWNPIGKPQLGQ